MLSLRFLHSFTNTEEPDTSLWISNLTKKVWIYYFTDTVILFMVSETRKALVAFLLMVWYYNTCGGPMLGYCFCNPQKTLNANTFITENGCSLCYNVKIVSFYFFHPLLSDYINSRFNI